MKNLTILFSGLLCFVAVPVFAANPNPGGGSTTCAGQQLTGVIASNLDVPAGSFCQLNWADVQGNVTVEGTLLSFSSQFDKNVTVSGAGSITIANGYHDRPIKGNLNISGSGQSGIAPANDGNNVVLGNINVTGLNNGGAFFTSQATVGGGVSVNYNFGRVDLSYLTISKNLDCNNNSPAPVSWSIDHGYGSSITAAGKTGQCAGL
jgi:hypothetical protein